ncbi:MAG TPA: hypothetical protein EYH32_10200 [Anaerolineae bacterium]|nr:hypothetical protein [Anaerolineae bacterium]
MGNYGPVGSDPSGPYERVCAWCKRVFRTRYPRQRYCSRSCKRARQNRDTYRRRKERLREGE